MPAASCSVDPTTPTFLSCSAIFITASRTGMKRGGNPYSHRLLCRPLSLSSKSTCAAFKDLLYNISSRQQVPPGCHSRKSVTTVASWHNSLLFVASGNTAPSEKCSDIVKCWCWRFCQDVRMRQMFGDRALSIAMSLSWNLLPPDVKFVYLTASFGASLA